MIYPAWWWQAFDECWPCHRKVWEESMNFEPEEKETIKYSVALITAIRLEKTITIGGIEAEALAAMDAGALYAHLGSEWYRRWNEVSATWERHDEAS